MIQGNFYERLHFYMDSCAITPMASLLDYIQLLIISWAIQAMKVAQNVKKWLPKWSKNEMLVFGLYSTSEEWPSNLSNKSCPKCEKMAAKMVKKWNAHFWIMFNFWGVAKQSEWQKLPKTWKNGWQNGQKMKCSFLDYVQLLMISQWRKSTKMQKRPPKSSKN